MLWYKRKRSAGSLTEDPENKPQRGIAAWFFVGLLVAVPLVLLALMTFSTIRAKVAPPSPSPASQVARP